MLAAGLSMLSSPPHFVILDLMLPDGNGLEVPRHLRIASSNAPVIVTSTASDPVLMQDVQTLQPFPIYRKPIDVVDLLTAMGKM